MNREPLTNADFALLRLDSPANRMIVTALITLQTRLELPQLKTIIARNMLHQPRLRQRVVLPRTPFGRAYWEEDTSFDIDHHIRTIHTALPVDPSLLEQLISRVMSVGLDFSRPLWEFYLVESYGDGSAIVMRFHHSIADGLSLLKLLLSMTQTTPGETPEVITEKPTEKATKFFVPETRFQKRSQISNQPYTTRIIKQMVKTGKQVLTDANFVDDAIRLGRSTADAINQLLFSPSDGDNIFRGQIGIPKRAAWSPGIPLDQVKFISKTFGSTVNDVLLCTLAGALSRTVQETALDSKPTRIHGFVPVDLRRSSRQANARFLLGDNFDQPMGNRFGFAVLELPLEIEDSARRLEMVHQSMNMLKASGEALVSYWVLSLLGAVSGEIQELAARFWLSKGSMVITNVAGPGQQLYLGDAAIDTCMAWVPQTGPVGLGVSIFSYNGNVVLGVAADQESAPDPQQIVDYALAEFQSLWERAQQVQQTRDNTKLIDE
jgi:diacylglycerol O-acyltransferase / wax synthase